MNRIKELEQKINCARNNYYNGVSDIPDKVYDAWIDELFQLDSKNLSVIGIGSEPISNWEKYTHLVPMGSLNKCQNFDEFKTWYNKYIDVKDDMFLTMKLDGLSISIIYENGTLAKASTRGNGIIGELITNNVVKMIGVPLRLKEKINATIRGEILLSKENHQKYFPEYSNTRNASSGISRRYDGEGSDRLSVLAYQLTTDDVEFKTQEQMFNKLQELGFIVPTFYVINTMEEVLNLKNSYQEKLRDEYEFDLDGLVVHQNNIEKLESFGSLHGKPYASIAYKFDSIAREGFISDIIIQIGNSGRITPIAVFNPKVNLMGAEIERASLHNFANITDLGISVGATVLVCRSNDVIPFIEKVIVTSELDYSRPIYCPECNTKLVEKGEYVQCPNTSGCQAQLSGKIKNWVKELNILEIGDALIEKLVNSKLVATPADLYTLTVDQLSNLDRMGKKSATNVYKSLWSVNPISLETFIGALSIPMIGSSTIKLLTDAGYDNLEKILDLTVDQVMAVKGIGPAKAQSLIAGLSIHKNMINQIIKNGVKIKNKVIGKLSGKNFAITGALSIKRAEVEKMIQDNGGIYKSSCNKDCTYLIIADPESSSSKAISARKLGVSLISEDDFLKMINN